MRPAIFCKSFAPDFERLAILLDSYGCFVDPEAVPLLVSVPRSDLAEARARFGGLAGVKILADESFTDASAGQLGGWQQQQVCKLSVHRTGFADTYLMLDSDSYFVRPLLPGDFLGPDGSPRIVLSQVFTKFDDPTPALLEYLDGGGATFGARVHRTTERRSFDLTPIRAAEAAAPGADPMTRGHWLHQVFGAARQVCQPSQWFIAEALRLFEHDLLVRHGIGLTEAIRICPWEYNWYAAYCAHTACVDFTPSVSPVLHFASEAAVQAAKAMGLTNARIAERFHAVQMAARHFDRLRFE